jgi:hypothetical protein
MLTVNGKLGSPGRNRTKGAGDMKLKLVGVILVVAMFAIFAVTVGTHAAPNTAKVTPAATATPAAVPETPAANASAPEKHPEIRDAMEALHRAKEHLEHAAHDFGGHRVDAIHAIDEAQHQLEICLKY